MYICITGFRYEKSCTTDGKIGTCIAISDCEYAISIIKRSSISSIESQNFLKLNQCGFEDATPKICCPEKESIVDNRNAFKQEEIRSRSKSDKNENTIPETANGRNPLSLFPRNCEMQLTSRILGGQETKLSEFPWMVALEYEESELFR